MKARGQASAEFIVVLGIIVLVLTVMSVAVQDRFSVTQAFKKDVSGRRLVNRLADNINQVVIVGDGFSQCVKLPGEFFASMDYKIEFPTDEPTVFLSAGRTPDVDSTWSAPIVTVFADCDPSIPQCGTLASSTPTDVWIINDEGAVTLRGDCGVCGERMNAACQP